MIDAKSVICLEVKKSYGWPVLPIEIDDKDLDQFIVNACHRYYESIPVSFKYGFSVSAGTTNVSIDSIYDGLSLDPNQWYFIGVYSVSHLGSDTTPGMLSDSKLAGASVPGLPFTSRGSGCTTYNSNYLSILGFRPLADILGASQTDHNLGEITVSYNAANNSLEFISSTGGSAVCDVGFGYSGDSSATPPTHPWDKVPPHHYHLLARLAAESVLESLVIARGGVSSSAGSSSLETTVLVDRLNELRRKNEEDLSLASPATVLLT